MAKYDAVYEGRLPAAVFDDHAIMRKHVFRGSTISHDIIDNLKTMSGSILTVLNRYIR